MSKKSNRLDYKLLTFNSLAFWSLAHKISGPLALAAVARARHRLLQVESPSSLQFTTSAGVWAKSGSVFSSGADVGNPPQEQFPVRILPKGDELK